MWANLRIVFLKYRHYRAHNFYFRVKEILRNAKMEKKFEFEFA